MERFRSLVEIAGTTLDAAGVLVVVGGAVIATARLLFLVSGALANITAITARTWGARLCSASSSSSLATSSVQSLWRSFSFERSSVCHCNWRLKENCHGS